MKFNSKIKRTAALIMCMSILLCALTSCSEKEQTGVNVVRSVSVRNTITDSAQDASIHYAESADSFGTPVASSGLIELLVDGTSNSFAVRETNQQQLWSALPLLENVAQGEALTREASMVSLKITGGTDIYHLNSQDNSVAYNRASHAAVENGAAFTFDMFPDAKTAQKQSFDKTDIGFKVVITVTLKDGSMNVACTHENLTGNPDAYVEEIELLNYFGAYNDTKDGDFLLVPDGCGAIIKTSIYDESFESLKLDVYGSDPSVSSESGNSAVIPAFGIKHGIIAFAAIIEKGDAIASINAKKATGVSEYNSVYPSFKVTPVIHENETLYISKSSAAKEIALCYRFLAGNNATYAGLASACREQLIRNSVLSTKTVEPSDYLPFYLTLTGAATKSFGPLRYTSTLTTFEQAQDMLIRMKNKGINNASVRYTGAFSGGINSKDITESTVLRRLGGTEGLSELYGYITSQKMSLFLDINLFSSATGFSGSDALNLQKESGAFTPENALVDYMNETVSQRQLRNLGKLKKVVSQVLTNTRYYGFSGYCLNDAGFALYSDFSSNGYLRESASELISQTIVPLSTDHSTMAVTGNFYMLKNINSVIDIPLKTGIAESGAYMAVPFVQLVLHGIVDYAGEPINTGINLEETLLKYVEFGACPHFQWNYEPLTSKTENDKYYYDNTINNAAEFYTKANEALNDLRDARMTDHYEVEDGIFCTEYDTGARIYVNYTNNDFSILGVVVEARNFLRVN